jgi:hypothetical protein
MKYGSDVEKSILERRAAACLSDAFFERCCNAKVPDPKKASAFHFRSSGLAYPPRRKRSRHGRPTP